MAYVYEHWRPDLGVPFYVGKGSGGRKNLDTRRNKHHKAIVAKLRALGLDIEVRIVSDNLTDEDAYALEIERIAFWKSQGIRLANQSTGGKGGLSGCKRSEESCRQQSATMSGRKLSPEHAEKSRARITASEFRSSLVKLHTGRKRPPETGQKISQKVKELWSDPEWRANNIVNQIGFKHSEEGKANMSAAKTLAIREMLRQKIKSMWADPDFRAKRVELIRRSKCNNREI